MPTPATQPGVFECADVFTGHIYRDEKFHPAAPTTFTKRVMSEWKQLRREVPADVTVKVSEAEQQLLKAAVVGAMHTPYYQGLYCFDVQLSADYPATPPAVKHHAKRLRLNPNLYDDGYVCLSLLGTWEGHAQCEQWRPTESNVLQVLLSIQAIILCKEPWYNEAGFDAYVGTAHGRQHSRTYSENIYLLKLLHLMRLAEEPPPDWVTEVRQHFRRVVPEILRRAREYLRDAARNRMRKEREGPAESGAADADADGAGALKADEFDPTAAPRINADGLVLPLSSGFIVSLAKHVQALTECHAKLTLQWDREAATA